MIMNKADWHDIAGYKGLYAITESGYIKNLLTNRCYKKLKRRRLLKNGVSTSHQVARLLLATFQNAKGNFIVSWKDHDSDNFKLSNLEIADKRNRPRPPNTKLTPTNVRNIRAALKMGVKGRRLAEEYDVADSVISKIKHGTVWRHVS